MRKTLLSFFAKAMLISAFVLSSQSTFAQIFRFDFESSTNVTTETAVGTPTFAANGVTNGGYSTTNPCLNLRLRSGENWDTNDYYRFNVNTTGYGNLVFSLCGRADNTNIGTFLIRGSADNGATWVTLLSTFTPGTTNSTGSTIVFPESLNNQAAVIIELLKTNNADTNGRTLYIDNALLTGNPIPTVTSFTPAGPICTGTSITITGTNFTGATAVTVNGTAVNSFNVTNATTITAVVAPGTTAGPVAVSNAFGSDVSSANLTLNPSPGSVTATPSATNICSGTAINLTASAISNSTTPATILTQNFNAATNDWTKTNSSTGGTPANAAWTLRPNNYNYNFTGTMNSNDASQFYFSNSDAQGNGTTTTILQSPAFSTVNYASASFSFYHYFRYNNGETARVRVSTDGSIWTTLESFTATVGSRTSFTQETYSLDAYLGQATVYVRFEYNATDDWYWAVDNVSITGNAYVTPTYAWTSTPAGFTSAVQNPTGVTPSVNTVYNLTVTNAFGCTTTVSTASVNVSPASFAGPVSANQNICTGTQPANLTIGSSTGTFQWQSSTDNNTFNNIAGQTTNTLTGATIGNLTATRYYRVVVTSGGCAAVNSGVVTVTVSPVSVAGSVSANQNICSGSQPANISIGTSTGTFQWQSSTDNNTFNNIAGQTTNTLTGATIGNLAATRYYRVVVTSGGCAAVNSGVVTVTVSPVSVAGSVSANQNICSGSQPANISIGTSTGSIQWQSSTDNNTFNNIAGQTTNTLTGATIGSLAATRYYRAVVTSGVCAAVNSAVVTVAVDAVSVGGTVSTNTTVCSGSNSGTLNLGAHTGNIIRWESSTDNFNTINTIANTTASQAYSNLTVTTAYRAVVQSGVCASANSVAATIAVDAVSVGGTVSGSTTVCATSNSGNLNLSGYTGNITKWQSSDLIDFSAAVLDIPNTSNTLSFVNLSGTTYYRAVVTNGVCSSAFSSVAAITVNPAAVGGIAIGSTSVCYGNNSGSLNLSGYAGSIAGWESSLDNFATAGTPIANTTATLNYSNLTATTAYRAIISGGSCAAVTSSSATVTVDNTTMWLGTNSASWSDAANWSCGIVPTTAVDVTITSVTNQPVVSADAFAHTVTLQTGTALTVQTGSALTVVDAIDGQGTSVLTVENDAHVIQVNDVNNNGIAVVKRDSSPLKRLDYILWSSPVTGSQTFLNFSPLTIATRFYVYNPATNLYNSTAAGGNFAEGKGYLIRMPDNHPATPTIFNGSFNGTLNNGDVDITVTNNSYNAIGNPYPSSIDANAFITQNNLSEALYFWRKTNNDQTTSYATYTLAGGVGTNPNTGGDPLLLVPDGIIQPGQGFIVKSTSTTLSFDNGMRIGNNGQFFRNAIERNRMWLNLTNAEGIFSQTMVSYMTGATNGLDAAIDGLYFNDSQLALNSMIGATEYAIQGRALPFDNADVVPLGVKVIAAGTYTIGLDHADGLFADASQDIFLKDNLLNSTHDLRTGNYTFAAEAGSINNRFEIVYAPLLAVANPALDANQVIVYKQGQDLVVNSGKAIMANVKVFDIRGRLLVEKDNVKASETKLFAGTTNQVLIVKITSEDHKEVTKKVIN